jgi:D-amino-acid oxidase
MQRVETVVVGAGVVGLAIAQELARTGREVLILEAADRFGSGISSRNSEVIHAGLYYEPGSLKARLCLEGRQRLYEWCETRGVAHRRCGKLIVATSADQAPAL